MPAPLELLALSGSAAAVPLFIELRDLTRRWSRHDAELPESRARAIGEKLYRLGGEELMQRAYYYATSINPAASNLSFMWDGIGEWEW